MFKQSLKIKTLVFTSFILLCFFSLHKKASAYVISYYDSCQWETTNLTNRTNSYIVDFLEKSKTTDNCSEDQTQDPVSALEQNIPPVFSPICFYASAARGANMSSKSFYYCSHKTNKHPRKTIPRVHGSGAVYARGPCLSQEYNRSISQLFHKLSQCFNMSLQDQQTLFEIINHESAFMPNAKSYSNTKCAGQFTTNTVREVTEQTLRGRLEKSAFQACPSLTEKLYPTMTPQKREQLGKLKRDTILDELESYPVICEITTDPVTCFLYTFLYYKQISNRFDSVIKKHGSFERSGSQPYTILSDSSNGSSLSDLEKFKVFTTRLSYNGGFSVTNLQIQRFFEHIRHHQNQNPYLAYIEKGRPLPFALIQEEFFLFLKSIKNIKTGKPIYSTQVFEYSGKVDRDVDYMRGVLPGHNARNEVLKMLENELKSSRSLPSETADWLANTFRENCPLRKLNE